MQTWAKRGLQTALVTGGLLMLGTGIASADENVSPDTPAGPVDVAVTVPVEIDNNALGLPGGQVDSPLNYKGEIGTGHITLGGDDGDASGPAGAAMAAISPWWMGSSQGPPHS